jgi:hypothetical protein
MKDRSHDVFEKHRFWFISYTYPDTKDWGQNRAKTYRFYLEIYSKADKIFGQTLEENYFSNKANDVLVGEFEGYFSQTEIFFKKRYLNAADQTHELEFKGDVSLENGNIVGIWNVHNPQVANICVGSFKMFLDEGNYLRENWS